MAQTSDQYGQELPRGQAGQLAEAGFIKQVDSFAAEGAVPFGAGVVRGTADDQCMVVAADSDEFVGVALFTHVQRQGLPGSDDEAEYEDADTVSVLSKGRALVEVVAAVDAGATAYVNVAIGASIGKFTGVATDNLATGGKFITAADAGELAVLEL